MLEIKSVAPDSTAFRCGIRAGDRLLTINGREVGDCIDVQYLAAEERLDLCFESRERGRRCVRIKKEPDDTLGIELQPLSIRRCRNRCIFCFVDQMPRSCRRSLYVKDDDYRASFLFGNYITLGNLREEDWDRIFTQRLSPLYVSVHATEQELRARILGNRNAPDIMHGLKRLADGGIRVHAQVVLVPGINDGPHLARTVGDLSTLFPSVLSIAVVPVGITGHRRGLFPLRTFRRREARDIIAELERMGKDFRKRWGTRLVFPSDELYIKSGLPSPPASFYEDFPQIENGVGMVAAFLMNAARTRMPSGAFPVRVTVVTGASFAPVLEGVVKKLLAGRPGLRVRVLAAQNRLFGSTVTVAGLLSGRDILRAIAGKRLGDVLVIPAGALKDDQGVFLDELSLAALERKAGVPVRPVDTFSGLVRVIREFGRRKTG